MRILARLNTRLGTLAGPALGVLLLLATGLVFTNVLLRYVFNYAISWAEEVTKYALLWLVFLGSGIAAREGGHVSMEALSALLSVLLSGRVRRLNAVAVNAISAVLSAIIGFLGGRLAVAVSALGQVGPASGIPVFWVYLAIPVGCALMVLGFWEAALKALREPERDGELPRFMPS